MNAFKDTGFWGSYFEVIFLKVNIYEQKTKFKNEVNHLNCWDKMRDWKIKKKF